MRRTLGLVKLASIAGNRAENGAFDPIQSMLTSLESIDPTKSWSAFRDPLTDRSERRVRLGRAKYLSYEPVIVTFTRVNCLNLGSWISSRSASFRLEKATHERVSDCRLGAR